MAFTKTAEYALRAVVELAKTKGLMNSDDIAVRTRVPRPYLVKVLQQMQAAGLVESFRGKSGGWRLTASKVELLTFYDVVQAVDPIVFIDKCRLGHESHRDRLCPLHTALNSAFAAMERSLKSVRVQDVAATMTCGVPPVPGELPDSEPEPVPA